jgi:hypothetical protein
VATKVVPDGGDQRSLFSQRHQPPGFGGRRGQRLLGEDVFPRLESGANGRFVAGRRHGDESDIHPRVFEEGAIVGMAALSATSLSSRLQL